MDVATAAPLREALSAADFTHDAVAALLGEEAHRALGRNETTPALRRTTDGSALATLTRLFLLQAPVPLDDVRRALPGLVDPLCAAGLLERSAGEVSARLDCRPYATSDAGGGQELWVVSDLTPGLDAAPVRVDADHVLGVSGASTSLAQLTVREPLSRALDLGTGCGVQALHLATHCDAVVATDVNPRALGIARYNAALNDVAGSARAAGSAGGRIDVRDGSFFEPVRGERFDLIATNPPFVISPATGERLVYRDSGLPGDRVVEHIVRTAPDHLTERGWCQVLANWVVQRGRGWDDRLAEWLRADCDALVVQREVVDPAAYVELWLKDAGLQDSADYTRRYDRWLSWLDEQGVEGVGFGWVTLRAGGGGRHELLDWPYDVEQPIAQAVLDWSRALDASVEEATRLAVRPDVRQETFGPPGAADPETIVLRQQRGLRRARTADTVEAALVGACDGELTVGQILDALAQLLGADATELRGAYLPVVAELVREDFLRPA